MILSLSIKSAFGKYTCKLFTKSTGNEEILFKSGNEYISILLDFVFFVKAWIAKYLSLLQE